MITKNPRVIVFDYHAHNHKKDPVDLSFSFTENDTYPENLKLFYLLLKDALRDVEAEINEREKA
jgi:hypothetical protein